MRICGLVLLLLIAAPASAAEISGLARIIDGDTLEIGGQVVRLEGIDAPESGQTCRNAAGRDWACGSEATRALAMLAADGIRCRGEETDRYGRLIAICEGRGGDINGQLVREGWALAFTRFSDRYAPEEAAARRTRAGLWAGSFTPPWDYRAARWEDAVIAGTPRDGCPIKGNISANGRIYHTPYSRDYARTRIDTSRGERWFCSEAEAIAAGWRAPRS